LINMSWSKPGAKKKETWNIPQQVVKKRKLNDQVPVPTAGGSNDNDDFDDSLELTQAELAEIDVIMTQAEQAEESVSLSQTEDLKHGKTSSHSETFSKPESRMQSSRSANNNSQFLVPKSSNEEVNNNQEIQKVKSELQKTREDKFRSEGEVRYLRQSMNKLEENLEKMRKQRDDLADEQKRQKSEKEKQLQQQVESLLAQAEFKDRELQEQRERMKKLQTQQEQTQLNASMLSPTKKSSSPKKIPVKPSPPSRNKQMQMMKSGEEAFPNTFSFMQQGKTMKPPPVLSTQTSKPVTTCVSCQTERNSSSSDSSEVNRRVISKQRRHKLNVPNSCNRGKDPVVGMEVHKQLLHTSYASVGKLEDPVSGNWDPGLAGLLHTMSTSLSLSNLTFTRGREASFISPVKPRRQELLSWSGGSSSDGTYQVVSRQHFVLAIEGLMLLLEEPSAYRDRIINHIAQEGFLEKTKDRNLQPTMNTSRNSSSPNNHFAVILLVPLLTDYLQQYFDLTQSSGGRSPPPASTSTTTTPSAALSKSFSASMDSSRWSSGATANSTGSYESSLDSLSSCIQQLLNKGKIYASSMESFAVAALRTFSLLLRLCPSIVGLFINSLLKDSTKKKSPPTNVSVSNIRANTSETGSDADDEKSTSSSEVRVVTGNLGNSYSNLLTTCETWSDHCAMLLNLVLSLAGQDLEDNLVSPVVVEHSLRTLVQLCHSSSTQQLDRLDVLLSQSILSTCLRHSRHRAVTMWAQRLLSAMSASECLLSKTCTKSENCPLFLMHRLCFMRNSEKLDFDKIVEFVQYINCVSDIIFRQKINCSLLFKNQCPCSGELVVSVILATDRVFTFYCDFYKSRNDDCKKLLAVLANAVILLHTLVQEFPNFGQHYIRAQMQYVRTLAGLLRVFREIPEEWEIHLHCLEELCDFEPDSGTLSQEREEEKDMEVAK